MKNKNWSVSLEEGHHHSIVKSFFKDCGLKPSNKDAFKKRDSGLNSWGLLKNKVILSLKNTGKHFTLPTQWKEAKEYICEEEYKCVLQPNFGSFFSSFPDNEINIVELDNSEKIFSKEEETPKLEVGKWYKVHLPTTILKGRYSHTVDDEIYLNDVIEVVKLTNYNYYNETDWVNWEDKDLFTLMSPQEIKEHLIECAKHRGLVKGAKIKDDDGNLHTLGDFEMFNFHYDYYESLNQLNGSADSNKPNTSSNPILYKDGKWTEVVEEKIVCGANYCRIEDNWIGYVLDKCKKGSNNAYKVLYNGYNNNEYFKTKQEARDKAEQIKADYLKR